ncbi:helix-turn-helix transcriptional regulator [Streptomyces milbemycinicus]|uniref:helix-turn-helix transcriptional regulator n=1 Tax=Streptomyces milbemycinicus TaxID=476552 RepID=UPI003F4CB5BF
MGATVAAATVAQGAGQTLTPLSDPCAILDGVHHTSVSPVFVGRAEELSTLTDALARAAAGEPQVLLVGGEAGVGKSRLVDEFLIGATAAGATAAVGGCVEIGVDGLPFAPVSTVLRSLRRKLGDELDRAVAGQEGELARLLPELGETARESREEDSRARLFELTVRLLERLAADRTLVVVVEDLHWADRSTRELLGYLFRSMISARLLVVATYRSDDIHRRHPLRPFLAEIDRMRAVRRIELPRFNRSEVRAQIAGINGARPERALVDRVFERSDGNAFFVEEIARSISEGCSTGLSESLRDLLLVRVEALPEEAQQVVRILAEGGSSVEYELLRAAVRLGEDDLIDALRVAVGANILRPSGDDSGYRFRHALVREAVADDLLPGERSRINRRYAEALEAEPALVRCDERAARLASYWYHAHDPAKALPAVLRASVEARRRYAHAEQVRLLERAMELWEDVPEQIRQAQRPLDYAEAYPACGCDDEALRHLDLLAELVVAANRSGQRERALTVTNRALRTLDESQDPLRAAWFWTQKSKLVGSLGRADGWAELGRAEELVRGLPPSAVHADVLAQAAGWSMVRKHGPDGFAVAERAVELARLVGARSTELHARLTLGYFKAESGDTEGGLAEMREVSEAAIEMGDVSIVGRCFVNLTSGLEGLGRSAEAVEVAEKGVRILDRFGLPDSLAWVFGNMAESLLSLGRWAEAEEAAVTTRRLAIGNKSCRIALNRFARLALARGDWDTAERELAVAREQQEDLIPEPQFSIPLTHLFLQLAAARGRILEVRELVDQTLEDGLRIGMQRYTWPLLVAAAAAEADARGLPAAEPGRAEALGRIRAAAKRLAQPVPVWRAYGLLLDAELARAEGHDDADRWADAVTAFQRLDRPHPLARARFRWAEALLSSGAARERVAEPLAAAHTTATRLGARPLREGIELLARRARLPLPAGPGSSPGSGPRSGAIPGSGPVSTPLAALPATATSPQDPAAEPTDPAEALGLTPRERDVLRLVALGRSNRQIAEELFISPKTASVHVSNILAKLEVSGRGEAAAVAHRLRLVDGLADEAAAR